MHRLVGLCGLVVSISVAAATPATQRAIRNLNSVFGSVTLLPELRNAVPPGKEQTAKNLLRDLDTACQRGERELGGIPDADKADPAVAELSAKLTEFQAFRDDLKKAIEGGAATSAAHDKLFREFREETKPYQAAVTAFRYGPQGSPQDLKAAAAQLAKLDALCKSKYPGIADDPKLSFQLNIEPGTWCATAAKADAIANSAISAGAAASLDRVVADVVEAKRDLAKNHGHVGVDERPYQLLQDRAGGKAKLEKQLKASLDAAGQPMPEKPFEKLDEALDAFAAEIDRLALTWAFEAPHHDGSLEAGAKGALAKQYPGRAVVKSGMLYEHATIDKNALGVPTERYRTGAVLAKAPGKWCEYREFTAHETYSGGGSYAAPRFTFGAVRFQKCP
ncbi:MAG: hypothetical protein GQE15_22050 [Archangiaceae bacterium]|nr:hypothetical protein [Archangiaceae bacterium]